MPPKKKKPFQDYYKLFGIEPTASPSEIKTAYRELALKLHPDQNPSPEAHEQFLVLNEAYHILNNPKERSKYDIRYRHFYNPHKKTAGLSERIELTRAKRASRYGRTMYSQRMRYRGSGPSRSSSQARQQRQYYRAQASSYDWDAGKSAKQVPRYLQIARIMALFCLYLQPVPNC